MENSKKFSSLDVKKVERYRWVVWTLLALVYVFVTFHRMGTGVVRNELKDAFQIGDAQFANIGSMYFYAYFIMQIPSGILADKIGPKKTVFYCSIIAAIGSVMFGLSNSIGIAYLGRFLVGIGVSVVFVCLIKIQSKWFYSKNFALMIGMAGLAANLGAVLAQTPLVKATQTFGWRNTFIYMGLIMVFFAILVMIFVKDDPKEMGLPGMDELENRPQAPKTNISVKEALKSVVSNKRTWIVGINYIGVYTGYVVLLGTYGVSFLMNKYNISKIEAASDIIAAIIGSLVSGLVIGYISDKLKSRKKPLIIFSSLTLLSWVLFVFGTVPKALLIPFLFFFGFVMSVFTLCWTLGNEVNDRRLSGIATGVVNCIGFLGAAVIPVVMGNILDANKMNLSAGYSKAFTVLIVVIAISTVFSFFNTETNATNVFEK